ncbi:MAG: hypothetical protein HLUCCA04_10150 [Oceanicaulis sp. HLUCCA04]|nr:MAG: hypothetical protein HLUCCA04_10150 [Oceanicaulis sp. HLUCCA04]
MKMFAAGLVAALGLSGAALAVSPSGHVYESTETESGYSYTSTFHADGRFTNDMGNEGTWTYADGELCITVEDTELCNPFEASEVGESVTTDEWRADGVEITITRIE